MATATQAIDHMMSDIEDFLKEASSKTINESAVVTDWLLDLWNQAHELKTRLEN